MKLALAGAALLFLLGSAFLRSTLAGMPDFEVYWHAGNRVLAAEPLYRDEDGHFRHKYWPVFGVLMAPLAMLPLPTAKAIWFYITLAAIAALLALSFRLLPAKKPPPLVLVLVPFFAMLKFFAHEVHLGQCNTLMATAVLAGLGFLLADREAPAGASFAIAAAIKPYPLLVIPYLLITRRLTALGVFVALVVAGLALPAAIYGVRGNAGELAGWVRTVTSSTPPDLLNQDNVSIWAMWAKWIGIGPAATAMAALTIAGIAIAFAALVAKGAHIPGSTYLDVAVLLVLIPLLSPQGWDYGLLMATPAVMLFVNEFEDLPIAARVAGGAAIVVMALAIFDVLGRRGYAEFMSLSAITVCALALLASVSCIRLRRLA